MANNTYMFQLQLKEFSGPIEKLLQLIEERHLEITRVNMAEVTGDFLAYVKTMQEVPPAALADFLVVASRLILIKSRALLPDVTLSEEEEGDIKNLEARLALYKEFKTAGATIGAMWKRKQISLSRELFYNYDFNVFYPPVLNLEELAASFENMLRMLQEIQRREQNVARSTVATIEEKMDELLVKLRGDNRFTLSDLANTKEEMVVIFLAILHLLKECAIQVEQGKNFYDIIIESSGSADRSI